MMPRLDGMGLLAALRSDPGLNTVLVVLLSARAGEEARLEGLAAGADDYLAKPFSTKELIARVDSAVRLAKVRREAIAREQEHRVEADKLQLEAQLRQAQKMEAVGQLTGGIAHDFNNLLGIIIGNLDIAAERAKPDPIMRESIEEALGGALRGAQLTRRLLAFSRNQPLQPAIIDLNKGLPQIAGMLGRVIGEQILVELHPGGHLWPALADPAQMDEAILNLAINARDAMPNGGTLSIETANARLDSGYASRHAEVTPGDYVQLSISDTGTGMSPDVIDRCFEPFFTTKGIEKGTGLGLSMVYGFVKQSGGHIKVYSELGHGTSVKIYLPRADRDAPDRILPEWTGDGSAASGELILIVEDNNDLRTVTVKNLLDLGYRTLEAETARVALTVLASHPEINLLFTDIIMPGGMTGTELAREARRLYPTLKILLTSGYTARAAANGFHDIGGLELLNKPFRKQDLAQKLRMLLEGDDYATR
jgi:signal transduction histidine kinase